MSSIQHFNVIKYKPCDISTAAICRRIIFITGPKALDDLMDPNYQDKYKELIKTEKSEGVAFAQIVVSTEIILEMNIDRNIKLYEFQYYMKAATEKIKQIERHNLK